MNETQAEKIIELLERIAVALEGLQALTDCVAEVSEDGSDEKTFVLNIWNEGKTE